MTGIRSASKKSLRAAEQQRPDVAAARIAWQESQPGLDPTRLVFIDETGTTTNMCRPGAGRSARGQRLVGHVPHGHWATTTFVGGLRMNGFTAPMVVDQPMNGTISSVPGCSSRWCPASAPAISS